MVNLPYNLVKVWMGTLALIWASCLWASEKAIQAELAELIQSDSELRAVFGSSKVMVVSSLRAESLAEASGQRQAIVLYRGRNQRVASGASFCNAALARPERHQWGQTLLDLADGDQLLADEISATTPPVVFRFKQVEEAELKLRIGSDYNALICRVSDKGWSVITPPLPSPLDIAGIRYALAKRLFSAQRFGEAQRYFKSVLDQPSIYYDAILYSAILLYRDSPALSDEVRARYVDLSRATDPAALSAFFAHVRMRGTEADLSAVTERCEQLGVPCR
jgi:hypothetical protein